ILGTNLQFFWLLRFASRYSGEQVWEDDRMITLSRREMFSGVAMTLGAACLAPGNIALAEGSEYMFAPGLIYLNYVNQPGRAGVLPPS
ncbi:MAG TPA: hypothetical protein VIV66_13395, partial [Pyrinomonadaceae bacterium]